MKVYDEKICRHALNRIFGFHPIVAHALLERFGSGAALFAMGSGKIRDEIGHGYRDIDRICDTEYEEAEGELREIEESGARFLSDDDPHYPALLKECRDRPVGLYIRSESSDAEIFGGGGRFVAVVGTRDLSGYGAEWCGRIVDALSACGERITIVSGLAIGTDIIAHKTALGCGLPTIAVLPTGIDAVYPRRHASDARRIVSATGSALVTDYPPNTAPVQFNFLRRNRIIAGLCEATVLVESKLKGGGMMTARLAASYFRDVFALPGRAGDLRSQGCNALIKEKLAEPIISETTLPESLGMKIREKPSKIADKEFVARKFSGRAAGDRIERLASVLLSIRESSGADIEQISRKCGLPYMETAQLVSMLECDGLINVDLMQRCTINYGRDKGGIQQKI